MVDKKKEKLKFDKLTPIQTMLALGGGLILFLSPHEGLGFSTLSISILYVVFLSVAVSIALIVILKNYYTVGVAVAISIIFMAIQYLVECITVCMGYFNNANELLFSITSYNSICWSIIWFLPFIICFVLQSVLLYQGSSNKLSGNFKMFFKISTISFYIYYVVLICGTIIFNYPIDINSLHSFNVIPFHNTNPYLNQIDYLWKILGQLILLAPIGITVSVYYPKNKIIKLFFIGLTISVAIQASQYFLNTNTADITYLILNTLGIYIGVIVKIVIDKLRLYITKIK